MLRERLSRASWRKFDWILAGTVFVLSCVGLAAIYSVDLSRGDTLDIFPKQVIALGIACVSLFVVSQIHVSFYESTARFFYIVSIVLLAAVLLFGSTIRGTTGWFHLAGFSFQPAEFAKVALIIFLAWRIERQARRFEKWQFVVASGVMALLPVLLIMVQPDLGSASILIGVWFVLLMLSGTKKRYIFGLIGIFVLVAVMGWMFFLKDYQKLRILTFVDPARDPQGSGYNVSQSVIAIGAGQLRGRGLGFGSQSQLHFLPEAQTDFIFSVVGEELGFVGELIVLGLYGVLVWRLIRLVYRCRSDFSAFTILGIMVMFILHIVVNIGGATGLLPVTGVTLPFLSYGGSSLIINFVLIGIAQSVARSS